MSFGFVKFGRYSGEPAEWSQTPFPVMSLESGYRVRLRWSDGSMSADLTRSEIKSICASIPPVDEASFAQQWQAAPERGSLTVSPHEDEPLTEDEIRAAVEAEVARVFTDLDLEEWQRQFIADSFAGRRVVLVRR